MTINHQPQLSSTTTNQLPQPSSMTTNEPALSAMAIYQQPQPSLTTSQEPLTTNQQLPSRSVSTNHLPAMSVSTSQIPQPSISTNQVSSSAGQLIQSSRSALTVGGGGATHSVSATGILQSQEVPDTSSLSVQETSTTIEPSQAGMFLNSEKKF